MKLKLGWRPLRIVLATLYFLICLVAFSGLADVYSGWMVRVQFAPALMKYLATFSVGALITVLIIALSAFLFGRFYCAIFCPLGSLQDLAGYLSRREARPVANYAWLRYAIVGIALGMLALGWTLPFRWLEPYSNFGQMVGSFSAGGLISLVIIVVLAGWKKRIYCTSICPVGTILGLFAKKGLFRLRLNSKCVKCGGCVKLCPSGCIDLESGTLDNERCVRCLNCISVCRLHAVGFELVKPKSKPLEEAPAVPFDRGRRAFLIQGGILLAGLAVGVSLAKAGRDHVRSGLSRGFRFFPPGAGDDQRLALKCTGCQLCVVNCPEKIISVLPRSHGTVFLDFGEGRCRFDCNRCSQVCPTGAIRPLTLPVKQRTKIAEAEFRPKYCIVFQENRPCGLCEEVCPTKAITLRANGTPRAVDVTKCVGCASCQHFCPASTKAMVMNSVKVQTLLEEHHS